MYLFFVKMQGTWDDFIHKLVHAEFKGDGSNAAQIICSKDRSFPGAEFF